ncbi:MAG TPA: DUF4349 domain-containing protein [Rhizomicrobium sp.]|jgi:hypothetical protein|nr:DUF4349 domain-containing protein [Rhizomicrobium sp.]
MVRYSIVFVACGLLLAGCERSPNLLPIHVRAPGRVMADLAAPSPPAITVDSAAQQFSYSHDWSLIMARAAIAPRFERARDLCLKDISLQCKLASANLTNGDDLVSATLGVQLPHDKLDVFEHALLAGLPSEAAGDAVMVSRTTQAASVETEASDTKQKVAQLTAYRDRLADIAKWPNLSVDDVIKVEAERARVQGDLDEATGSLRDLNDRIVRESVAITLSERSEPVGPFTQFARNAGDTLAESTGAALLFAIGALPWLPIAGIAIVLVSWLWRWLLRRRKLVVAVARPAG